MRPQAARSAPLLLRASSCVDVACVSAGIGKRVALCGALWAAAHPAAAASLRSATPWRRCAMPSAPLSSWPRYIYFSNPALGDSATAVRSTATASSASPVSASTPPSVSATCGLAVSQARGRGLRVTTRACTCVGASACASRSSAKPVRRRRVRRARRVWQQRARRTSLVLLLCNLLLRLLKQSLSLRAAVSGESGIAHCAAHSCLSFARCLRLPSPGGLAAALRPLPHARTRPRRAAAMKPEGRGGEKDVRDAASCSLARRTRRCSCDAFAHGHAFAMWGNAACPPALLRCRARR